MSSAIPLSDNLRGAAFMTLGMAGFAINDSIVKSFSGELGVGQVTLIRGVIASCLVFLLARHLGHMRRITTMFQPLIILRSLADIAATYLFLNALFHLPIANATAILQFLPLALTLAAAVLLREKIGWRRLTAILIGLVGVLVIVRPGMQGFNSYSFYALAAVLACVIRDLTTRQMHSNIPAMFITFTASVAVTIMGAVLCLFEPWRPVTLQHFGLLSAAALVLLFGYYGIIVSMRMGDVGFISPFRYFILLFATLNGMIFFSEFPDGLSWIGFAIIVATGIYTLYRERVVRRQAINPPATIRS